MKFDLYIKVDPPDQEIGRAITIPEMNKNVPEMNAFLNIPIGGILYAYLISVNDRRKIKLG